MATLDDKLLGEKLHYYCSSSEDEDEGNKQSGNVSDKEDKEKDTLNKTESRTKFIPQSEIRQWEGSSANTGPKGVIRDWQRFKQLENEKREQQEKEKLALAQKLSTTCRTHLDDEHEKEREKLKHSKSVPGTKDDFDHDDEFLKEYLEQRMKALMLQKVHKQKFGFVIELETTDAFLENTEKSHMDITTVVLLYEDRIAGCNSMKNSVTYLAAEYPEVRFCQMRASIANLSSKFKSTGLPALQAYRNGDLIGNFIQLVKEFGEEIYSSDVESFLIEHGVLQDKSLVPPILRGKKVSSENSAD